MSSESLKSAIDWALIVLLAWSVADCIDSLLAHRWEPPLRAIPVTQLPSPQPAAPITALENLLACSQSSHHLDELEAGGGRSVDNQGPRFPHTVSLQGVLNGELGNGLCFLQVDGQARTLTRGDKIGLNSEWTVASLESRRVMLSNGRGEKSISIGETVQKDTASPATEPVAAKAPPVSSLRNWRELLNKPTLLADLKAKPIIREGDMIGARLTIPPGHLINEIGLKNQDILLSVNGHSVDKPGALAELLPLIRNSHTLVFEVERQGKIEKVVLELE